MSFLEFLMINVEMHSFKFQLSNILFGYFILKKVNIYNNCHFGTDGKYFLPEILF